MSVLEVPWVISPTENIQLREATFKKREAFIIGFTTAYLRYRFLLILPFSCKMSYCNVLFYNIGLTILQERCLKLSSFISAVTFPALPFSLKLSWLADQKFSPLTFSPTTVFRIFRLFKKRRRRRNRFCRRRVASASVHRQRRLHFFTKWRQNQWVTSQQALCSVLALLYSSKCDAFLIFPALCVLFN